MTRGWSGPLRAVDQIMQRVWGMSPVEGARAPVYVATASEMAGMSGQFFNALKPAKVPHATYEPALGERLWTLSEQLTARTYVS